MLLRIAFSFAVVAAITGCVDDKKCNVAYDTNGAFAPAQELRDPNTGVCQPFDYGGGYCDGSCGPCPGLADIAVPDWGACNTNCDALDENTCKSTSGCRAVYVGSTFDACWSVAMSGPIEGGDCTQLGAQECSRHDDCIAIHAAGSPIGNFQSCAPESAVQDPGSCVGTVTCAMAPPVCPSGTTPGQRNGCWTGYCIPNAQCDQLPACNTLGEMACIDRSDCEPLYTGSNCTCNGASCTCTTWTFDSCDVK